MDKIRKLMEFYVIEFHVTEDSHGQIVRTKHQFCVYGTYCWKKNEDIENTDNNVSIYPKFNDLSVTRVLDGKEIPYNQRGSLKYIPRKAISMEIHGTTKEMYQMLFLDEGLKEFVSRFHSDENYVLSVCDLPIYKYIVSSDLKERFELHMVTNDFIYYSCDGMLDVLATNDHRLVSDNEFADICYLDSIENIKNGTEKLIFGTNQTT